MSTRIVSLSLAIFLSLQPSLSLLEFTAPLLTSKYISSSTAQMYEREKRPVLLYVPGIDGTLLSPFIQWPEINRGGLDVLGLRMSVDDRNTFEDIKTFVIGVIEGYLGRGREVYLCGESFGGVLCASIMAHPAPKVKGVILVNPATSYRNSNLRKIAKEIPSGGIAYFYFLLSKFLPLFTDDYSVPSLFKILSGSWMPAVLVGGGERDEAYLGRTAFSLVRELNFVPPQTMDWRLNALLMEVVSDDELRSITARTLVIAAERDKALPSTQEAKRIENLIANCKGLVIAGAGHSSTLGSRCDLLSLMQEQFKELAGEYKKVLTAPQNPSEDTNELFGLIERDPNTSLSPLRYWDFVE